MRMNEHNIPTGLFKVFCVNIHKDLNGNFIHKKVCIQTVYSIDYAEGLKMYKSLEELNPKLELHYTFSIWG